MSVWAYLKSKVDSMMIASSMSKSCAYLCMSKNDLKTIDIV